MNKLTCDETIDGDLLPLVLLLPCLWRRLDIGLSFANPEVTLLKARVPEKDNEFDQTCCMYQVSSL